MTVCFTCVIVIIKTSKVVEPSVKFPFYYYVFVDAAGVKDPSLPILELLYFLHALNRYWYTLYKVWHYCSVAFLSSSFCLYSFAVCAHVCVRVCVRVCMCVYVCVCVCVFAYVFGFACQPYNMYLALAICFCHSQFSNVAWLLNPVITFRHGNQKM